MNLISQLFFWIGSNFTTETYLFYTKIQGIIWSVADIVLVLTFLKIAEYVRRYNGETRIRWRYGLIIFSAALTPFIIFTQNPRQFYFLESAVCGIQFAVLIYTVMAEGMSILHCLRQRMDALHQEARALRAKDPNAP